MEIGNLTYLWIHTANRLSLAAFSLASLTSTLGACQKMVVYPLYRPRKRVDQVREGQGQSLVNSRTASHRLMDREAAIRMSGLHRMHPIS